MEEYSREPCPWRIIDDCGGAFSMGLIGMAAFLPDVDCQGFLI
jgi:import inner membrane translocase subunit TIM17